MQEIERVNDNQLTEWFRADQTAPTLAGWYEVRNCGGWTRRNRLVAGFVNGRQMRYWDGTTWRAGFKDELKSIMGRCSSHQWRGLRVEAE